jgi:hypothetical protein
LIDMCREMWSSSCLQGRHGLLPGNHEPPRKKTFIGETFHHTSTSQSSKNISQTSRVSSYLTGLCVKKLLRVAENLTSSERVLSVLIAALLVGEHELMNLLYKGTVEICYREGIHNCKIQRLANSLQCFWLLYTLMDQISFILWSRNAMQAPIPSNINASSLATGHNQRKQSICKVWLVDKTG